MNDGEAQTTPLWRFSLRFYRQTGIVDACIALQDACGADVNLLLFLLWLAAEGRLLSAAEVKALDDKVRPWRELAIVPLRALRRRLKTTPGQIDASAQEAFRESVKALELHSERLEQDALYALSQLGALGAAAAAPPAAARANLKAYERATGSSFPKAPIELILGAFGDLEESGL